MIYRLFIPYFQQRSSIPYLLTIKYISVSHSFLPALLIIFFPILFLQILFSEISHGLYISISIIIVDRINARFIQ